MDKDVIVNIIGAGISGLNCAITLSEKGYKCNLISNQISERAQSVLAEGGINAALNTMGEDDSPILHYNDTLKGGCYLASEEAVKNLCDNAPRIVMRLKDLGVPFNMKDGQIIERNFGGQKKKRTAYAKSSTGKIIMTSLIDEVRKYEVSGNVFRFSHHLLKKVIIKDNIASGVVIKDTFTNELKYLEGPTILCIGGLNGIFPEMTTGTTINDGNAQAELFMDGVEFANLEFIQYHPTTIGISSKRMLISEAARGEGGRLFVIRNNEKWYFMEEKYPELKNLMPRDVVSKEMYMVVREEGCQNQVYLDLTSIKKESWKNKLSDLRTEIISYFKKDPMKEYIPVDPGIHFFMGGINVNVRHETNIKNLYAAGECASIYHGANRLGGNSLLAAMYGGEVSALSLISNEYINNNYKPSDLKIYDIDNKESLTYKLRDILLEGLGIKRCEEDINSSISKLDSLLKSDINELDIARINLGLAMLYSAKERKESRGAHYRSDYPLTLDDFRLKTLAYFDGKINIKFVDLSK